MAISNSTVQATPGSGARKGMDLLRRLGVLNQDINKVAESRRAVRDSLLSLNSLPPAVQDEFLNVITDWLVTEVLGFGYALDEYDLWVKKKAKAGKKIDVFKSGVDHG